MDARARVRKTGQGFLVAGMSMITTRRRFVRLVSGSLAVAGLVRGFPAIARGDDDGPPNVFFSPHGRPFRAPAGAAYPVADWFSEADRNGDGKLDREEFAADAAAFFDVLDLNGDGALDADEIAIYEQRIAPEVLGVRVTVYADGRSRAGPGGARLWLAQYGQMEGPISQNGHDTSDVIPGRPAHGGDPNQGAVLPQDVQPNSPGRGNADPELTGAAPYSLIAEPEPVTASDPDYLFNGRVNRARFLAHAHDNFALLDPKNRGYLTLAELPQSPVQAMIERRRRKG
jgi:hypothetical protein